VLPALPLPSQKRNSLPLHRQFAPTGVEQRGRKDTVSTIIRIISTRMKAELKRVKTIYDIYILKRNIAKKTGN